MRKKRTFTVMAILLAVLILGVGYAAIDDIPLLLNGNANILANADFSVEYDTEYLPAISSTDTVTDGTNIHDVIDAEVTDTDTATMTVWLDNTHRSAYAIFKVVNKSSDLSASLDVDVTTPISGGAATYFGDITTEFFTDDTCTTPLAGNLAHGAAAYLKVTVPLAKSPLNDVTNGTFVVTTTASPEEAD